MDFMNIWTIARKELRDALRNRWFVLFTLAFAGLALALSALSQPTGTQLRLASYSRTAAQSYQPGFAICPAYQLDIRHIGSGE